MLSIEQTVNFSVDSAEFVDTTQFIDDTNKSLFRKMRIRAFASGENAHTLPVDKEVIERCAYSVYDKPIVWKYNRWLDDAEGHEPDEVPVGFIKESSENPVVFEQIDNRIFMTVTALIWTKYCGRLIEVFEKAGGFKDVSIEINTRLEEQKFCDKPIIKDFCVQGITILGEAIAPAVKGCGATLLEFSTDKSKYLDSIEFADGIKIDNSAKSAVSGAWSNPRRKLFNPIVKASNKRALLKEAYLVGNFSSKEPEITKFKYPHHVIRDGKLVVHKDGVQAAFQRASQQGIVQGNVKAHLLKHYRELGLTTENFSEFGISENDFSLYFADYINQPESGCEQRMEDTIKNGEEVVENSTEGTTQPIENSDGNLAEVDNCDVSPVGVEMQEDNKDTKTEEVDNSEPEEIKNSEEAEVENSAECGGETAEKMSDDEHDDDNHDDDSDDKQEDNHDDKEENMSIETAMSKIAEMSDTIARLEADKNAYMAKLESMSDYEDLKKFKCDTEERMAREAEMSQMESVMSEITEKGFSFSEDDKQKLMSEFKNFSSIDAWKNYVKAQVFDRADSTGFVRMGLPVPNTQPSGSIWDRI